jgi:chromosome partitioning protein
MSIIVAGGTKGGSGKSTLAAHLAVMRSAAGRDVLLADSDHQASVTYFTTIRNEKRAEGAGYTSIQLYGQAVRTEIKRLAEKYDDIIIDVGGKDTAGQRAALTVAHVVLIPVKPRSFDLWAADNDEQLIEEARGFNEGLRAYAFINCADPRGQDNQATADLLKQKTQFAFIDTPLTYRKAFSNAVDSGLAVTEYKPEDEKAIEEIRALYKRAFSAR